MDDDFEDEFEIMRKMMKRMLGFDDDFFKPFKEIKRYGGPKGYSVTIKIGSDGKPIKIEDNYEEKEGFLVDIIPSKDNVKVIMELPEVEEDSIYVNERKGGIEIGGQKANGEKVSKKIALKGIVFSSMQKRYKNGILELSFEVDKKQNP